MASRRRVLVVLAALALSAGACGSSSSDSGSGGATQTSPIEAVGGLNTSAPGGTGATTTTGPRKEPTGRVVYGWHTALTPAWLDPQEAPNLITSYGFMYAIHDSMIKSFPGQQFAPSLAESYEMAPDFKSVSFVIRESARFHNGEPVTADDVEFTYPRLVITSVILMVGYPR